MSVTENRRQTDDGRAIAYSEHEREFTFAKNEAYVWRAEVTHVGLFVISILLYIKLIFRLLWV